MVTYSVDQIKKRFDIVGNAPALNRAIKIAIQIAATNMSVLITGENGSGKESFAKIIHYTSLRKHNKFLAVNCGAIPEGTVNSELFGHEKGAFTSASEARKGYFEEVNGGTIFLDEIGELPLYTQPILLRFLENKEFIRVGSSETKSSDARIIAATNIDLQGYLKKKQFREDLYYRIAQVQITIPPLRERKEDIELLFKKFVLDFTEQHETSLIQLTPEASLFLKEYPFPGNIRQLKNLAWQIAILERENPMVTKDTLQKYLPKSRACVHLPTLANTVTEKVDTMPPNWQQAFFELRKELHVLKNLVWMLLNNLHMPKSVQKNLPSWQLPATDTSSTLPHQTQEKVEPSQQGMPSTNPKEEKIISSPNTLSLKEHEKWLIQQAIDQNKSYKAAAKQLNISERTFYRKMQEYNLSSKRNARL